MMVVAMAVAAGVTMCVAVVMAMVIPVVMIMVVMIMPVVMIMMRVVMAMVIMPLRAVFVRHLAFGPFDARRGSLTSHTLDHKDDRNAAPSPPSCP